MTDLKNTPGAREVGEGYGPRGLGPWIKRNPWLLFRLFFVMAFGFMVAMVASNLAYGLQGAPVRLSAEQIKRLLDRPDVLHALGEGLVNETKTTL